MTAVPTGSGAADAAPVHRFTVRYDEAIVRGAVTRFMTRRGVLNWRLTSALAGLVVIGALNALWGGPAWLTGAIVGAAIVFLGIFVSVWRLRVHQGMTRLHRMAPPTAEVTLDDDGIAIRTVLGEAKVPWAQFCELWVAPRYWLLFVQEAQYVTLPVEGVPEPALAYAAAKLPQAR